MGAGCNIIVPRGDRQKVNATVEDDDGNTLDLTLVDDVKLQVSETLASIRSGDVVINKSGTNLSANGTVDFTISKSDTESLTTGLYFYQILVKFSNTEQYTAETTGRFFVQPHITV